MAHKKWVGKTAGVVLACAVVLGGCAQQAEEDDGGQYSVTTKAVTLTSLDSIVPVPAVGDALVTDIGNDEYTGSIRWYTELSLESVSAFQPGTVHVAAVSLSAKTGYSFTGTGSFTHSGATEVTPQILVFCPKRNAARTV